MTIIDQNSCLKDLSHLLRGFFKYQFEYREPIMDIMTERFYEEIETPEYPDGIKYYILLEKFPTFLQSLNIPQNMTYPTPQDDSYEDIFEFNFNRHLPIISALLKELSQQRKMNSTATTTSTPSYQRLLPNLTTTPIDYPPIPTESRRRRSVIDYDDSDDSDYYEYYDIMTTEAIPGVPTSVKRERRSVQGVHNNPFSDSFLKIDYEEVYKKAMEKDVLVSRIVEENLHRV